MVECVTHCLQAPPSFAFSPRSFPHLSTYPSVYSCSIDGHSHQIKVMDGNRRCESLFIVGLAGAEPSAFDTRKVLDLCTSSSDQQRILFSCFAVLLFSCFPVYLSFFLPFLVGWLCARCFGGKRREWPLESASTVRYVIRNFRMQT